MTDGQIVDLYLARDEDAVGETGKKYGRYLFTVAYNVLGDESDAAECVNDAYLKAWESIPDARPASLSAYLGKITRRGEAEDKSTPPSTRSGILILEARCVTRRINSP